MKVTATSEVHMLQPCDPRDGVLPGWIVVDDVTWRVSSCSYSHQTRIVSARCYRVDNHDRWRTIEFVLAP